MIRHAVQSREKSFIVGTETGLLHSLKKACPDKTFHPVSEKMVCKNMKKITLADVLACLETMQGEVKVPEHIRRPALKAVERMLALGH
jgi:quinolinate synthase